MVWDRDVKKKSYPCRATLGTRPITHLQSYEMERMFIVDTIYHIDGKINRNRENGNGNNTYGED